MGVDLPTGLLVSLSGAVGVELNRKHICGVIAGFGLSMAAAQGADPPCLQDGFVVATTGELLDAPFAVRPCDVDGDGDLDIVTANDGSDTVSVLLDDGAGHFGLLRRWAVGPDPGTIHEPVAVACCDWDGDGLVDLITANHTSDDVSILWNAGLKDGIPQFGTTTQIGVGEAPWAVQCLPLNPDAHPDLVVASFTTDNVAVLINDGLGGAAPDSYHVGVGDGPRSLDACDVDGDGDLDVVTANFAGGSVSLVRNHGSGGLVHEDPIPLGRNPFSVACCELNGVSGAEIITANLVDDSISLLVNDGSGSFLEITRYAGLNSASALACGDLDGDRTNDVLTANLSDDSVAVLMNAGNGTLLAPGFLDVAASPSSVALIPGVNRAVQEVAVSFSGGVMVFPNACALPAVFDSDLDGDVDLVDAAAFLNCPGEGPLGAECGVMDINGDGSIDGVDASELAFALTGPLAGAE